ncbi:MAG TPA: lipoate--protein ligase family protein [Rhabdochlamydiaceae bacterium]|nr:lipoate--protein ligase family protein [Rhabdochlamydiaceae bacterium]
MTAWEIVDSGIAPAAANMALDAELLSSLSTKKTPILHFYGWSADCFTYGHFVQLDRFINLEKMVKHQLECAKRPTGGGIVFHIWDLAFSVLVPDDDFRFSQNTLENYDFVNRTVLRSVQKVFNPKGDLELIKEDGTALDRSCFHFCMAKPTKYDILFKGKKIIGAAQRKTKHGFLHQGTISLMMPDKEMLEDLLLPGTKVVEAIFANTFPLLGEKGTKQELLEARKALRNSIEEEFKS